MPLHNNEIILEIKYPIAPSFDWLIDDPLTVHDGAKFRKISKKGPTVRFSLRSLFSEPSRLPGYRLNLVALFCLESPLWCPYTTMKLFYPIALSFDWLLDDLLTVHDGAKFKKKGANSPLFSLRSLLRRQTGYGLRYLVALLAKEIALMPLLIKGHLHIWLRPLKDCLGAPMDIICISILFVKIHVIGKTLWLTKISDGGHFEK